MPLFSHYGDIPDCSSKLSHPSLVFAVVTPLVVLGRFLSRRGSGKIGGDDWVVLGACAVAETVSVQMIVVCAWAFGKHVSDIQPALLTRTLKLYFISQILYKVNIGLTKISILLFYIRLFIRPRFLRACWTCLVLVVVFTLASVLASVFQCTPVEHAFDGPNSTSETDLDYYYPSSGSTRLESGKCINLTAFWYANAAFNILSDVVIILLPIPVVVQLHLPRRTRGGLCAIFAVGVFVCITSVLRITTLNIATSYKDITWDSIPSSMWTVIESNLGVICACLPALRRPLLFAFSARGGGSISGTTNHNNNNKHNDGDDDNGGQRGKSHYGIEEVLEMDEDESTTAPENTCRSRNRSKSGHRSVSVSPAPSILGLSRSFRSRKRSVQDTGAHAESEKDAATTTTADSPGDGIRKTTKVVVSYDYKEDGHDDNMRVYGYVASAAGAGAAFEASGGVYTASAESAGSN